MDARALRGEDLNSLRHRAYEYFMEVNRPVASHELARYLFDVTRDESISPLLVRTLLGRDRRFCEARRETWELARSPYRDRPLREAVFTVVDLEATGSRPQVDRILEVGMVRLEGGRIVERYGSLVNPLVPIPRWIRGLTGIDEPMLQDAPRFHQVAPQVMRLLEDAVFVAHNVDFDYPFLRWHLQQAGIEADPWPQLCTVRLCQRSHPEWRAFRLDAVCRRLEIPLRRHHRAVADAEGCARVLQSLLGELSARGVGTVGEVLAHTWLQGDGMED